MYAIDLINNTIVDYEFDVKKSLKVENEIIRSILDNIRKSNDVLNNNYFVSTDIPVDGSIKLESSKYEVYIKLDSNGLMEKITFNSIVIKNGYMLSSQEYKILDHFNDLRYGYKLLEEIYCTYSDNSDYGYKLGFVLDAMDRIIKEILDTEN